MHPISGKERRSHTGTARDLRKQIMQVWWWEVSAFSGSLGGLELVPAKWRFLVPGERRDGAQSRPPAGNGSLWAW